VAATLDSIRVKIERAEKHIKDFGLACQSFFEANQYRIGRKDDPQTRQCTFYVTSVPEIPPEIAVIAGDAFHSLRSALDYLAWGLVEASGNTPVEGVTGYPICESPSKYKTEHIRKVEGMRKEAIDFVNGTEPYKGGHKDPSNTLWRIHELDKIDKHRFLITVASQYASHSMTPSQRAAAIQGYWADAPAPNLRGVHRHFPLKAGDELLTVLQSEVEENMQFRFVVAFRELRIVEGEPVTETLQGMADFVRDAAPLLS